MNYNYNYNNNFFDYNNNNNFIKRNNDNIKIGNSEYETLKIKILREENESLKTKNKTNEKTIYDLKKSKTEMENKIKDFEIKNTSLNVTIKDLNKKINNLENQLDNKKAEIIELNKNYNLKLNEEIKKNKELNNSINKKNEKINLLETNIRNNELKYNGVITNYDDIIKKNKNQEKEIAELKEKEKENTELKKKIIELNTIVNENETKDDYIKKSCNEYYDVVVDINSIFSLKNEGWRILYNERRKEIYQKIISEQTMKIGVLGLNNVGKSYLLSKIVKVDIPTGYSIETKGISIKYSEENEGAEKGICILDSAGFETPLLKNENKNENNNNEKKSENELENNLKYDSFTNELSRDKAQTERFIEQLIISLSDMLIIVIGKLTRTEQRLISRIKNLVKKNETNKIKSIIIVHNLAQYHKNEEIKNHIEQYLLKSATFNLIKQKCIGDKKYENKCYYVEEKDQEDLETYHYIMAKEGTEAGKEYNNFTMDLIKSQFNSFNQRKKINIPEEIIKLFSQLSTEILGEKMECIKKDENTIILADKNLKSENENNQQLHVQNMYYDQDGFYLKNKRKFEPKYSLYYYKEKKKNKDSEDSEDDEEIYEKFLLLKLELPGNIEKLIARSTDPKTEKFNGIFIKVIKKKDEIEKDEKEDFTIISEKRNYGEFSYFIELEKNLILSKSTPIGKTQIYEFYFDKNNKEKKSEENKKGEEQSKNINNEKKIASGVYLMKFKLTENSFIPNK